MTSWIPNGLSLLRIGLTPLLVFFIHNAMGPQAACVTAFALITDVADGWIARLYQCESKLGKILDPLADKIFSFALFVSLVIKGDLPFWLLGLLVARDVGLVIGGLLLWRRKREVLSAHWTSKLNTALQAGIGICCLLSWPFAWMIPIMVGTTLVSSVIYALQGWKSW